MTYLIVSILIIVTSDAIARRIAPDDDIALSPGVDADTIHKLAFCVVGVILMTGAITKLAQFATNYVLLRRMPGQQIPITLYGQVIAAVVQIIVGAVLFFQTDGLVGIWRKSREANGIQKS